MFSTRAVLTALRHLCSRLLDATIPPRERTSRTMSRTAFDIPLSPASHYLLGSTMTTLMNYEYQVVKDLIHSLKYDGSLYAADLAAEVLADFLREEISNQQLFSARKILLIPVPLHKTRVRARGWNQSEIVLHALPKEFRNGPLSYVVTDALTRTRATVPQTSLPRLKRLVNVAGAFAANGSAVHGAHVYLLDDVTTTGSTLFHAAEPLKRAGATVTLLALARA